MNLLHTSVTEENLIHEIVDNGTFANMSAVINYHSSECVEATFLYRHGEKNVNHKTVLTMTPEILDLWRYNEKNEPIHHQCYFETADGTIGGKIEINTREFAGDADCSIVATIEDALGINWKNLEDCSIETFRRNIDKVTNMINEIKDGTYRTFEERISDIVHDIISKSADDDDWDAETDDDMKESK